MRVISSAAVATGILATGGAAANAEYPVVDQNYAETNLGCYMHTTDGTSLDLGALCGFGVEAPQFNPAFSRDTSTVPTEIATLPSSNTQAGFANTGSYNNSDFVNGVSGPGLYDPTGFIARHGSFDSMSNLASGPCDYPWQTDAIGRSCGGRAASVREGGRFSDSDSGSEAGGSNCTFVGGYYRNGSYVRGHRRCG